MYCRKNGSGDRLYIAVDKVVITSSSIDDVTTAMCWCGKHYWSL